MKLDHEKERQKKQIVYFELWVQRNILSFMDRKRTNKKKFEKVKSKISVKSYDKNVKNYISKIRDENTPIFRCKVIILEITAGARKR